jgi:predicted peptidase
MRLRIAALLLGALLPLAGCSTMSTRRAAGDVPGGQWRARSVAVDGRRYPVQVFVPARPQPREALVLFLHGSGERGDDGVLQTTSGLGPYVRDHAAEFPAYAVLPQAPLESDWAGANARAALAAVDMVVDEFPIDPDRIYLTGMSRGGYGTWDVAMLAPDRFAALAPICAGVRPPKDRDDLWVKAVAGAADPFSALADGLAHLPIWIFHGALDDLILPDDSRRMFAELKQRGANVRYTEFPRANHNAWDPTYNTPEFWAWLFAQRRAPASSG